VTGRLQFDPDEFVKIVREHRDLDTGSNPIGDPGIRRVAPLGKEALI
jgi:hypothetical protein